MATKKLDPKKQLAQEYRPSKRPVLLRIGKARYLAIEGHGRPGGDSFQAGMGALFAGAYTMKFRCKAAGRDYPVGKPEAIYWADGVEGDFSHLPPEQWRWQLLSRVPSSVGKRDLAATVKALRAKGHEGPIGDLRIVDLREGLCVQMLHVGPYAEERRTIAAMHEFAREHGLGFAGRHHEIYGNDPRRTPPAKLKTLLRHPVHKRG